MNTRILKMADACAISGYTRDQMRALLRDLPTFVSDSRSNRNRTFTRVELLAIAIISTMEKRYGVKRAAIGAILEKLVSLLQKPRKIDSNVCLVIIIEDSFIHYSRLNESVQEGLIVPLTPIFEKLDTYLGVKTQPQQIEIGFGLSPLAKVKKFNDLS